MERREVFEQVPPFLGLSDLGSQRRVTHWVLVPQVPSKSIVKQVIDSRTSRRLRTLSTSRREGAW